MSKKQDFRIIVIDDDQETCNRVEERIAGIKEIEGLRKKVNIEVDKIKVDIIRGEDGQWLISPVTIHTLIEKCQNKPDLIIGDYGYANEDVIKQLKEEAKSRKILSDELEGSVFTPVNVRDFIKENKNIPESSKKIIKKNFFSSGKPVILYSYPSKEFFDALGPMDARKSKTGKAFNLSNVIAIDTKKELYRGDDFDSPSDTKKDPRFYAYQLSVVLDYLVQMEILRVFLEPKMYYGSLKYAIVVGVLTSIAAAIGFAGQWIGSLVHDMLIKGDIQNAIIFGISCIITLFVLGFVLPFIVGKIIANYISITKEGD